MHTVVRHSSTSTYMPNFIEIEATFCGRMDVRTYGRTFETGFIRSTYKLPLPLGGLDLSNIWFFGLTQLTPHGISFSQGSRT